MLISCYSKMMLFQIEISTPSSVDFLSVTASLQLKMKRTLKVLLFLQIYIYIYIYSLVSLFNGISTFVGYLMPKPFSWKNSTGTI